MTVLLRPMTKADLDKVLELEQAVFRTEAWSRQMLAAELEQQPASRYYLVADDGGGIAGYAGLLGTGWQGDVVTLAVAADRWGEGIGSPITGVCSSSTAGMTSPRSESGAAITNRRGLMPL
jgi:ribosomal-protein-alanine N-acetyltransferase